MHDTNCTSLMMLVRLLKNVILKRVFVIEADLSLQTNNQNFDHPGYNYSRNK